MDMSHIYSPNFIVSFIKTLKECNALLVIYVVAPAAFSADQPLSLRNLLAAFRRPIETKQGCSVLIQFIPDSIISMGVETNASYSEALRLAHSVYDRILVPVDRHMSRPIFKQTQRIRKHFQAPALTIARPVRPKASFVRGSLPHSLDVLDRHTFCHVAYSLTPCRTWLVASCTDQRGEAQEFSTWLYPTDAEEDFIASHVWEFVVAFARQASTEWRVAICSLGHMTGTELTGTRCIPIFLHHG